MGYSIKSKKINIVLTEAQQEAIPKKWLEMLEKNPLKTW